MPSLARLLRREPPDPSSPTAPPIEFRVVEWLFLKALAIIYLIAFVSFGVQAQGLIGSNGILPVASFLRAAGGYFGASRIWRVPTVLWLGSSDGAIQAIWIAGVIAAVLIAAGYVVRPALIICFVMYLSIVTAGQDFMSFQWDLLLLETGFLAIFIGYSRVVIWLFRWLIFRLMFLSGCVKLLSGDKTWRDFTAMAYHYWTQPLPNPIAWYMAHLPFWFQQMSTALVFFAELIAPLLMFAPRRVRFVAAWIVIALQLLIIATGNFAFFNVLSIALCLFLFDDRALARILPSAWIRRAVTAPEVSGRQLMLRRSLASALAFMLGLLTLTTTVYTIFGSIPSAARSVLASAAPFGIANSYGLFAVMTTTRPEIVVEGSDDGTTWKAYEFKYKAGDVYRGLPVVAPYQPRLDWQMWFAALGTYNDNPWFVNFMARLLEGSPPVLSLLRYNPFPAKPPHFVRATVYDYRFTDWNTRWRTGAIWTRELTGTYLRQISLADLTRSR